MAWAQPALPCQVITRRMTAFIMMAFFLLPLGVDLQSHRHRVHSWLLKATSSFEHVPGASTDAEMLQASGPPGAMAELWGATVLPPSWIEQAVRTRTGRTTTWALTGGTVHHVPSAGASKVSGSLSWTSTWPPLLPGSPSPEPARSALPPGAWPCHSCYNDRPQGQLVDTIVPTATQEVGYGAIVVALGSLSLAAHALLLLTSAALATIIPRSADRASYRHRRLHAGGADRKPAEPGRPTASIGHHGKAGAGRASRHGGGSHLRAADVAAALFAAASLLRLGDSGVQAVTQTQALLAFKAGVSDPNGALSSWTGTVRSATHCDLYCRVLPFCPVPEGIPCVVG